jgi:hypothetical protein
MSYRALFVLMAVLVTLPVKAQDYSVEELSAEETTAIKPFSIMRVSAADDGLRIFINTDDPANVAGLLDAGSLHAQLSDHEAESETQLTIDFGKAVACTTGSDPVYLAYGDPDPDCAGQPPATIEYFFNVAASLGPNRDLAIGEDPDFMWLIEER